MDYTNAKNVNKEEWYDSVSVNQIDNASVITEMIYMLCNGWVDQM